MQKYTTRTSALRATKITARVFDTKTLKIDGKTFDPQSLENVGGGINNIVKISTTFGSIDDSYISDGQFTFGTYYGENGRTFDLQKDDGQGADVFTPIALIINDQTILSAWNNHSGGWDCTFCDTDDDLSTIYGGITDSTMVSVVIAIHSQEDGNEPVKTTLSGEVTHNTIYHLGEMSTLKITLPSSLIENYSSEICFTSGATPTSVTCDGRIKWVGDDVSGGVFTPIANVRYSCTLQYDGVFVRGMSFGIPTT